jgi:hypothetical protein
MSRQPEENRPPAIAQTGPEANSPATILPSAADAIHHPVSITPPHRGEFSPSPFEAIDGGHLPGAAGIAAGVDRQSSGTLPAGVQLKVGYQDPVLGYLELRAHRDASGVHASLGAQSESAGAALSRDLDALATWMEARQTPAESLSVVPLHGGADAVLRFANGESRQEDYRSGEGTAGGGNSGAGPDRQTERGPQAGSDAAAEVAIGRSASFGQGSQSELPGTAMDREPDLARQDALKVGGSISVLA